MWADINNDGMLDLFVVNERGPSQLFLNKGDGTFEDISHSAGIDRRIEFSKGVTAADYDGDGYVAALPATWTIASLRRRCCRNRYARLGHRLACRHCGDCFLVITDFFRAYLLA